MSTIGGYLDSSWSSSSPPSQYNSKTCRFGRSSSIQHRLLPPDADLPPLADVLRLTSKHFFLSISLSWLPAPPDVWSEVWALLAAALGLKGSSSEKKPSTDSAMLLMLPKLESLGLSTGERGGEERGEAKPNSPVPLLVGVPTEEGVLGLGLAILPADV